MTDDEKQLRKAAQAVLDAFNGCPMIEVRHRQALTELQAAMTAQAGKHQGRGRPQRVDESKVRKLVAVRSSGIGGSPIRLQASN